MAYCRITGKSRGLPKPNYFPLLPPISASAAKRYCRITGKSYGLPSHNFIPVILTANLSHKVQCKITSHGSDAAPLNGLELGHEYGQRKHILLPEYRYLFPKLDEECSTQRELIQILEAAQIDDETSQHNYVYRVDEKQCNLVFPARLESAIRDGNVRDVMLAKDSDRILLKMHKGTHVSVEMYDFNGDGGKEKWDTLYDGEGPSMDVILEKTVEEPRKKRRPKKLRQTSKAHDANGTSEGPQTATGANNSSTSNDVPSLKSSKQILINQVQKSVKSCSDLVKPMIESWDWKTYEQMALAQFPEKLPVELPTPIDIEPIRIVRNQPKVQYPELMSNTIGFDAMPHVDPMPNVKSGTFVEEAVITSIKHLSDQQLADTENVIEKLEHDIEHLPMVEDLPKVLQNMNSGKFIRLGGVSGLKLDINKAHETFIPGQNISTPTGDLFIPGHTVQTRGGPMYVPGLAVNTPGIGLSIIPGFLSNPSANEEHPKFVVGQVINDQFVPGQAMGSPTEARFCEGQTILDEDGKLAFVAGIIENDQFICGQTLNTPNGNVFIPGQTITMDDGEIFLPGQSVQDPSGLWKFVEGKSVLASDNTVEFIPGRTVKTVEGAKFIPGQMLGNSYVAGIQKRDSEEELSFVPGVNIDTDLGPKFIRGLVVESEFGSIFMPGVLEKNIQGSYDFSVAKTISEIVTCDPAVQGFIIDPNTCEVGDCSLLNVFGFVIQTETGKIEFYPEKVPVEHRLAGKAIPGKLFKQNGTAKFIPGVMSDDNQCFIAGQIVSTENGDQFVPGQVVETGDGLKFVPGQVIETKTGSKFVPGQTFETSSGPRFIPGQIVETRGGPTFIPGQVISNDGCDRFVPGQVVDTEDGPRFVPGRVVEEGDGVTFIPGQIVETAEGPRFVAPDLLDNDNDEQEFSVQSFLVTPEELKLIKPNGHAGYDSGGDCSLDTTILRQLSEAGMSIGRQIEMSAVDLVLQSTKDAQCLEMIKKVSHATPSNIIDSTIVAMRKIVEYLNGKVDTSLTGKVKTLGKPKDPEVVEAVESLIKKVYWNIVESNKTFLEALSIELGRDMETRISFEDILTTIELNPLKLVNKLYEEIEVEKSVVELVNLCQTDGVLELETDILVSVLKRSVNDEHIIRSLEVITACSSNDAIKRIFKEIQKSPETQGLRKSNAKLVELIQDQIQETINQQILNAEPRELNRLLMDTIQLAKALEIDSSVTKMLGQLIEDPQSKNVFVHLKNDPMVMELISRTFLIRELIAKNSSNSEVEADLLQNLRSSPYSLRANRDFLDIFRTSGALITRKLTNGPSQPLSPLKSSNELPSQVLFNDNPLVIEDYLMKTKTKTRDALVIIKDHYKAVVPRHLSHAVLTGKCSYTLIDENGISHYEPLNVFEALNMAVLKKMPTIKQRFSSYQHCKIDGNENSTISLNMCGQKSVNGPPTAGCENKPADSDEIDCILAMASSCNTFGMSRVDSSFSRPHFSHLSGAVIHNKAVLPRLITSFGYF